MNAINYDLLDTAEVSRIDDKTFAVSCNTKIFYVGEVLYDILVLLKERKDMGEIQARINEKFNVQLDSQKLQDTIRDCFAKLESNVRGSLSLYSYIYGKLRIIGEEPLKAITKHFTSFFNKWVILTLFLISFLLSFYFMGHIYTNGLLNQKLTFGKSLGFILLNYLFVLVAGLFHELGHSSASARYKMHSKEVGFGFYLIFPVFYTDVSKIWMLDKYRRIIINLAGVYFQFILNTVLVAVFFLFHFSFEVQVLIKTLFITNCSMCVYALNPFMRNDGYWVYSDFFNIPNLTQAARAYPVRFWKKYVQINRSLRGLKRDIPLLIYSILFHIILGMLWVGLSVFTYNNYQNIRGLASDSTFISNFFSVESLYKLLLVLFACSINLYFLYRTLGAYVKNGIFKRNLSL